MHDQSEITGATPGEDTSGLIRAELTTRRLRDLAETEVIDRAYHKHVLRAHPKKSGSRWFTDEFIRKTHFDMFGEIWDWAGKYRTVDLNIGIPAHRISEEVGVLCGDFNYWKMEKCHMPPIEIAARLQNRLTRIHLFANGNGRHARLMTDIFLKSRKHQLPKWPQIQLLEQGNRIRKQYIEAMKKADKENYTPLIQFIENYIGHGADAEPPPL